MLHQATAAEIEEAMHQQIEEHGTTSQSNFNPREWIARLERNGIRTRYRGCVFERMMKYQMPDTIRHAMERAKRYAENFEEYKKRGTGLLLIGPVGTMKTSIAVAIAQEIMRRTPDRNPLFVPMAELFDQLMTASKKSDPSEFIRLQTRFEMAPLLIIDDLGAEYPGDWIRNKVDAIVSSRYNRCMPMIVTSNLAPSDIMGQYRERVYDRLKGSSIVIRVTAPQSMRRPPEEL